MQPPAWRDLEPMEPRLLLSVSPLLPATLAENLAPNIILLIGDGMGPAQIDVTAAYLGRDLSFESFPYQGEVTTYSASGVTDSAAAATAMATGEKVNNGVISVALPGDGSELTTSLEIQRDLEKMTGLVTTVYMSHATPAGFGAHDTSRNNTTAIAADYLNQTHPNVLLGGGGYGLSPSNATDAGYTVITDKAGIQGLDVNNLTYLSGQFGTGYMPYELDGNNPDSDGRYVDGTLPDLSEMTALALDVLDNDPDGFFLMVEGGLIDQACHSNDLERAIGEVIEFDETVTTVYNWAQGRSDTLILVTADHETGGLSLDVDNGAGNYPTVSWTTTGHTGVNVPIYAWGMGAEAVAGVLDNTDIFTLTTPTTPSSEVTVSFQQNVGGYAGAADTQLRQAAPDTDYSGLSSLNVDSDEPVGSGSDVQALLRFDNIFGTDAGQIPTDRQIISAQLQLQVTNAGNSMELYRLLGPWLDSATWNSFVDGIQADDVEAMATADAVTVPVTTGVLTIDVTTALGAWQAAPSSNYGWALLPTGSDGVDFDSAEGATPPQLIVTYETGTPNQAPVAEDDSATVLEDSAVTIDVLANDTDADNDPLAIASVTQPANGSVALNPDSTITYTPDSDFNGSDSFTYNISDGRGGTDTGAVSLTVTPDYDAPVAVDDSTTTTEGSPVTIDVLNNDRNPDGQALLLTIDQSPAQGTVAVNSPDQTVTYTPAEGFTGTDEFTYAIDDGMGGVSTANVAITVTPGLQTLYATDESGTSATIAGSLLDTQQSDDQYERLTEIAVRKKNVLEHTWFFSVTGGNEITFHLEAHGSGVDDGFLFQYSTDGAVWTDMFTVTATNDSVQTYSLPAGLSGNVSIRVVDTNHAAKETGLDTLSVDAMWISTVGGAPVLPTVTVSPTDPTAAEGGDSGTFTITRQNNTSGSLTVYYTLGGTATNGVDYAAVDNRVVFSDGETSKTVTIAPLEDEVSEPGGETVILTIDPNTAYDIGADQIALLTIVDDDTSTTFVDYLPTDQTPVMAKIETDPSAEYEVLAEKLDGKKSVMEHIWTFDILDPAASATFNVEAWHDGTEDDFLFQYSLDGVTWIDMLTITATSDSDTVQTYELPSGLVGTVYIRVLDTNHAGNQRTIDRLYLDKLFIHCT